MTYQTEFPDFDPATMPAIPIGWTDQSWHNDSCPSFDIGNGMAVFIDFAEIELREVQESGGRFSIHVAHADGTADVLMTSDDWDAVMAFVQEETN